MDGIWSLIVTIVLAWGLTWTVRLERKTSYLEEKVAIMEMNWCMDYEEKRRREDVQNSRPEI